MPIYICQRCFGQVEPEEVKEVDGRVYHRECAESAARPQRVPIREWRAHRERHVGRGVSTRDERVFYRKIYELALKWLRK